MKKIGLTGGIGSGKSTVAKIFNVLGVPVFNADEEGRRLLNEDAEVKQAVIETFGAALYASGELDRKALAAVVFKDPASLARLNSIVHPAVRNTFNEWCATRSAASYVIMEAAILAESGGHAAFDHIVVVTAPEGLRLERVMERDGSTEAEVLARMKNQATDHTRSAIADFTIDNSGEALVIPQVLAVHEKLLHA